MEDLIYAIHRLEWYYNSHMKHKITTYHPQTNKQAEVTNRKLKRIPEKIVANSHKDWFVKLVM